MDAAAVIVSDLRKRYGGVVALDGLSFEVPAGKVLGLLGPNGSGKTTTVAILSTALRPDGGRAWVCGHDVVAEPAAVRASIGFAGQYAAVDDALTGRENLTLIARLSRLPRRRAPRRAADLLDRFGLTEAADRMVRTYSGGMRRRLDVAAALAHRPPVLFLDEPTTGLDPESRLELWAMIRELVTEGTSVLLTTQYLHEADALADEIVIADRGRVTGMGTPTELKERVGSAVLELSFADESGAASAEAALATRWYGLQRSGAMLRLPSGEGSRALTGILRALESKAPDPIAVAIHQPGLDEVFMALTGNHLTPGTGQQSRGAA